jgi:hypothetical protein
LGLNANKKRTMSSAAPVQIVTANFFFIFLPVVEILYSI